MYDLTVATTKLHNFQYNCKSDTFHHSGTGDGSIGGVSYCELNNTKN
jgi:hypothetical protein